VDEISTLKAERPQAERMFGVQQTEADWVLPREVEQKFEKLKSGGVRFNVETVDIATQPPRALAPQELLANQDEVIKSFYSKKESRWDDDDLLVKPTIEVSSLQKDSKDDNTIWLFGEGLVKCCMTAFADHHPLVLSPDDIWGTIAYGFARHVEENAEALRSKFVKHEGKKVLLVEVDDFVLGKTPATKWESDVFPNFSKQIKEHIGAETHALIAGAFTTTTPTHQASHEITLMAAMKKYFAYKMRTRCGIPWVQLDGTVQDWKNIRTRAELLREKMMPEFAESWVSCLIPVLDQFVAASEGEVNPSFWQSMVKRRHHGRGSGAYSTVSGWIGLLFPYLKDKPNGTMKPWEEMWGAEGPWPTEFPQTISSTAVVWEYLGTTLDLHFHAGVLGASFDKESGALRPVTSWIVSHDPPTKPEKLLPVLEKEYEELEKAKEKTSQQAYEIKRLEKKIEELKIVCSANV